MITFRIEMGSWERDRLEGLLAAQTFNKVTTPIVAGMSDVSFMLTIGALLTLWFPNLVIPYTAKTTAEIVDPIVKAIKEELPEDPTAAGGWLQDQWAKIGVYPIDIRDPSTWSGIIPGGFGDPQPEGVE